MAGNRPADAVEHFLAPLRRVLSCVTPAILLVGGGYHPSTSPHALTLSEVPAPLGRDGRLALKMIQHYRIVEYPGDYGPWKVQTVAYYYALEEAAAPYRELIAYHWHPQGHSPITYPHLHLYAGTGITHHRIPEAHFPTGRIALEQVLRLAIEHFQVQPLRSDWATVLDQAQQAFEQWRTWH